MAERIKDQPSVRDQYAAQLVEEGVVTQEDADNLAREVQASLKAAHEALKASFAAEAPEEQLPSERTPPTEGAEVATAVDADRLRALNEELLRVPERFTVHPKLERQLQRRREQLEGGEIDWGHGEALAFASLLVEGIPVRLTGQDTERGTFSQRHLVLHDPGSGEQFTPMQRLGDA